MHNIQHSERIFLKQTDYPLTFQFAKVDDAFQKKSGNYVFPLFYGFSSHELIKRAHH
jgi:hypothetical protein